MHLEEAIEHLCKVQLFQGFPEDQLRLLAFGSEQLSLRPGDIVFRQNDLSDGGYVILSGQVDLVIHKDGEEIPVAKFMSHALVGEVALISVNRRVTTAIARTPAQLMHIPRAVFRRMLDEYPELAILLHQRIGESVKEMVFKLQRIQDKLEKIPNLGAPS